MVFYYAVGGGLGHLSRAKKVLKALNINDFKVITAQQSVDEALFSQDQLLILKKEWASSPQMVTPWISRHCKEYNVNTIFIDTFPIGIVGEISNGFPNLNVDLIYVARFLKWFDYEKATKVNTNKNSNRFQSCFIVDELHPLQEKYIESQCAQVEKLPLIHQTSDNQNNISIKKNTWLIAHSMPISELQELLAYAKEVAHLEAQQPNYLICTTLDTSALPEEFHKNNVDVIQRYPIDSLIAKCERFFTACGYNIMNETTDQADKHHFLPFPRRYDDQYLRAQRRHQANKK